MKTSCRGRGSSSEHLQGFSICKSRVVYWALFLILFTVALTQREDHKEIIYLRNSFAKFIKDFQTLDSVEKLKDSVERISLKVHGTLCPIESQIENSNEPIRRDSESAQRPDLSLYNSGGRIVGVGRDTKLFYSCNFFWKILNCPNQKNGPENVLKPSLHPGDCFGFIGGQATIYIQLIGPAIVDSVTIQHIEVKNSPHGNVAEAPRNFSIFAFNEKTSATEDAKKCGSFTFSANKTAISTFDFAKPTPTPFKYVKIQFHENNGNPEKTCVYRVQIHGVLV